MVLYASRCDMLPRHEAYERRTSSKVRTPEATRAACFFSFRRSLVILSRHGFFDDPAGFCDIKMSFQKCKPVFEVYNFCFLLVDNYAIF